MHYFSVCLCQFFVFSYNYSLIHALLLILFKLFAFDRIELVSDITKTVLLTIDIGTKLNGTVVVHLCDLNE